MTPRPPHLARRARVRSLASALALSAVALLAALVACTGPTTTAGFTGPTTLVRLAPGASTTLSFTTSGIPAEAEFRIANPLDGLYAEFARPNATTVLLTLRTALTVQGATADLAIVAASSGIVRAQTTLPVEVQEAYTVTGTFARVNEVTPQGAISANPFAEAIEAFGGVDALVARVEQNVQIASGRTRTVSPAVANFLRRVSGESVTEGEHVVAIGEDGTVLGRSEVDPETGRWFIPDMLTGDAFALVRARSADEFELAEGGVDIVCIEPLEVAERDTAITDYVRTRRSRALLLRYAGSMLAGLPTAAVPASADGVLPARWQRVVDVGAMSPNDASAKMASFDANLQGDAVEPTPNSPFLDASGAFRSELLRCGSEARTDLTFDLGMIFERNTEVVLDEPAEAGVETAWLDVANLVFPEAFESAISFDLPGGGTSDPSLASTGVDGAELASTASGSSSLGAISLTSPRNLSVDTLAAMAAGRIGPASNDEVLPLYVDACINDVKTCNFAGGVEPVIDLVFVVLDEASVSQADDRVTVANTATLSEVFLTGRVVANGAPVARASVSAGCFDTLISVGRTDDAGRYTVKVAENFSFGPAMCDLRTSVRGIGTTARTLEIPAPGTVILSDMVLR